MKFYSLWFFLLAIAGITHAQVNNGIRTNNNRALPVRSSQRADTSANPVVSSVTSVDNKVIMSSDDNNFEISPLSSFNNGLLLQPVDRVANRGINTAFYLDDTSSWSFYTDARRRFTISGNGNVSVHSALLINNALPDDKYKLIVNGAARVDTSLYIQSYTDTNSFISFHRNVKSVETDADDSVSPYTLTPTAWALGHNIPVFRMRHPNNVANLHGLNTSTMRDLMILPYVAGFAIEFNGVVECWVGEWSIHKGVYYNDVEGKGNGHGAVLWVGDDVDRGGVRVTARNNIELGGNVHYGEISVETFIGTPHGDFRFRLPSNENEFHYVYGEKGSTNIIAKMKNQGLVIPKIPSITDAQNPEKAQIVYDSTDNQFKGYNGSSWTGLSGNDIKTGSYNRSSTGTDAVYAVPHGLGTIPSYFNVIATSQDAANISYVTADASYLFIYYVVAPIAGVNNISWNWQVRP